ncbi:unnamed protein product, partial [Porites lobata]
MLSNLGRQDLETHRDRKCTDIFPKRPTRGALSILDPR